MTTSSVKAESFAERALALPVGTFSSGKPNLIRSDTHFILCFRTSEDTWGVHCADATGAREHAFKDINALELVALMDLFERGEFP